MFCEIHLELFWIDDCSAGESPEFKITDKNNFIY